MPEKSETRLVTGEVRLSFVHLFEPWTNDPEKEARYSVTLLIPKSDKDTIKRLRAAEDAAKEEGKSKWGGKVPPNVASIIHDGDEEADLDRSPEYAGNLYMTVGSKQRPGVVDRNVDPILDPTQVYSGCYARVSLNAFSYNTAGKKGVSFGLGNVQFLRDGDPLGGWTRAEDDFDAVEDDLV